MATTTARLSDRCLTIWVDHGAGLPYCVVTRGLYGIAHVHSRWATEANAEGALAAHEHLNRKAGA